MSQASSKKVLFSSAKMAVATLTSRVLGLVREQVMAATFGASGITDAFTVAYRLPNLLRDLFAEGAFSAAFVPIFTEERLKSDAAARRLLGSILLFLSLVTLGVAIAMIIFAEPLVILFTDDAFTSDPERLALTTNLTRIMAPFLALVSVAALFMGVLNSIKVFFLPALAPAAFNIAMILCMILLPAILMANDYHPAYSLGIGVIAGGLAQLLLQVPQVIAKGFGPTGPVSLWSGPAKKIVARVGISTVGVAATQVNLLVTTILATGTQIGAVSWLSYAFRLFQFPVGILSVSLSGSTLVHFSDEIKAGNKKGAVEILRGSYLLSFITIVPAMVGLWILSEPVVNLVFQRGQFSGEDTVLTAQALRCYAIGLPAYGIYKIFAPVFFALDKPKVPIVISVASILLNIIFCLALVPHYGFTVLALGTTVSMMANAFMQIIFMSRELKPGLKFFVNLKLLKVFLAGTVMALVGHYLFADLWDASENFLHRVGSFAALSIAMIASYGLILFLLGEMYLIKKVMSRK
ncbi:MAG: murein biosynthesis integral membrane protein MurJ [Halobacteriovorax sp.]|nr:murein biosynthesis integral membrane protein MurJ [Halobacteriovorax sp.]